MAVFRRYYISKYIVWYHLVAMASPRIGMLLLNNVNKNKSGFIYFIPFACLVAANQIEIVNKFVSGVIISILRPMAP